MHVEPLVHNKCSVTAALLMLIRITGGCENNNALSIQHWTSPSSFIGVLISLAPRIVQACKLCSLAAKDTDRPWPQGFSPGCLISVENGVNSSTFLPG